MCSTSCLSRLCLDESSEAMSAFAARVDILPEPQRQLWPELAAVPRRFVLYGGTAIALRLGHRSSVDFDFFSSHPFTPGDLRQQVIWLNQAEPLQSAPNTLTVLVQRGAPVKVSFFGGLRLGRVGEPEETSDHVLLVASLLDLAATKVAVIQQRAEQRDYRDLTALLEAGVSLDAALAAAQALYREQFNPMISLKALSYFADGDLPQLPQALQDRLRHESSVLRDIPPRERKSDLISPCE
jgi:hypothetical protein